MKDITYIIEPKPMVYRTPQRYERGHTIICEGNYKGYHFIVTNCGYTHPCAYVEVPKDHPYYGVGYSNLYDVDAHGSLTYAGNLSHVLPEEKCRGKHWLGWDYAHAGDYYACCDEDSDYMKGLKKWTTEEIVEECQNVIDQLIKAKENR